MKAYFSYINARKGPDGKRGVYGRQIVCKYYDDGYNPANSVQLTRKLVQEDKVFAVVGSLGTEVNDAIRPYLNSARVPHVLVSTGASHFGREYKQYPWTIGWQPDYVAEGRLYGADIRRNHRNAKIAILYQNDSYGKDYVIGFKSALGDANAKRQIVGEEPFDVTSPSPASQIAKLRASGADTLMIFVTTRADVPDVRVIRALSWKPTRIYLNSVTATDALMATAVASLERRHRQRLDQHRVPEGSGVAEMGERPDVKQYKALMAKYNPRGRVSDGLNFYGFAKAHTFVRAMYKAGQEPDAGIADAGASLLQRDEPLTLCRASAQDERDGPLHHLAPAAEALQRRHLDAVRAR